MYAIRSYYASAQGAGRARGAGERPEPKLRLGIAERCVDPVERLPRHLIVDQVIGELRITSYNVCYTKLLRCEEPAVGEIGVRIVGPELDRPPEFPLGDLFHAAELQVGDDPHRDA